MYEEKKEMWDYMYAKRGLRQSVSVFRQFYMVYYDVFVGVTCT